MPQPGEQVFNTIEEQQQIVDEFNARKGNTGLLVVYVWFEFASFTDPFL